MVHRLHFGHGGHHRAHRGYVAYGGKQPYFGVLCGEDSYKEY